MQPLDKALRNKLESSVKRARDIAEDAAKAALEQLGVGEAMPFNHLSEDERKLRRKLRVHGRQLGDIRDSESQKQETIRIVEEVAYQHWHRMLFARFLAENNLLMYPDPDEPVAVSLEECEDLAADEGAKNGWELAARYASKMLPQIFRLESPVFKLTLSPEHEIKLEQLLGDLPIEMFTASDSLGWVYQYWQAKRKDDVNASEVKIGARELPAVTQLFTEPYMVSFLLDNALGAWWASKRLSDEDLLTVGSEKELRQKASLQGVPLDYLRFVKDKDGKWTPAAGIFENWPEHLSELKTLDPCCGSGHFLVAAFLMLVPMRMELENLTVKDAVDAVLRDNLNGLELDQRCVELAAFALAIEAWKYPEAGGYRKLPEMNIACSGLSVHVEKKEWKKIAQSLPDKRYIPIALDWMYEAFKDAPILGSLLDPTRVNVAKLVNWEKIAPALKETLNQDNTDELHEAGVVAHGLAKATYLLSRKYNWTITNVPYLKRGNQNDTLKTFCEKYYKVAKNDLATVFLDRCLELCREGGTANIVLPQNWLYLTTYKKFREKLLQNESFHLIARLGSGAFETITGEVVKAILLTISRGNIENNMNHSVGSNELIRNLYGIDVSEIHTTVKKASSLISVELKCVSQVKQLENPDARVTFDKTENINLLSKYASSYQGITTGDNSRFIFTFWETNSINGKWKTFQSTGDTTVHFTGREQVFLWEKGEGYLATSNAARIQGQNAWDLPGVAVRQMGKLPITLNTGSPWDMNCATIVPKNQLHLPAIWCFCSSSEYSDAVRRIDQSLKVTSATLGKVPFDLEHWTKVAKEKYPNGLPKPYSVDPTQWIFHGHLGECEATLLVAVARLLGFQWPAELETEMELSDKAQNLIKKCDVLQSHADKDGIVSISSVRGEATASDRILNLLKEAYGDLWNTDTLPELLEQAEHAGKSLDSWLRDKFFTQHCKLFHHRPFIWQIWDGLSDGFSALINYHKLDYKLLEILTYNYLGDWISRQKDDLSSGIDGAEEKLAAAENLKKKLELILEGEAPYDIFVRWKSIEKQPIGWNPDLNDGVRLNIRPFMTVGDIKKKGAGILRDKPNIKWNKDRGKDVSSAPWYHLGPEYEGKDGDRINDHHLTLTEKQKARESMLKNLAEEN